MTDPVVPFDLCGALPTGRWSLEASAGTGKTFAITNLAVRFVAEGWTPIERLLIVTFTRATAAELIGRIRERLRGAISTLTSDPNNAIADPLFAHLAAAERSSRLERLSTALQNLEIASISTIDAFATQALASLGTAAKVNFDAEFVANDDELLRGAIADCCARYALEDRYAGERFPRPQTILNEVKTVLSNPGIRIEPSLENARLSTDARLHCEILHASLRAIETRRRLLGVTSYSDQLHELQEVVATSPAARGHLRDRYSAVLIDEVQDTNPAQWEIFHGIFGGDTSPCTLVMVGDPKQAIYRFRGANVHAYLNAVDREGMRRASLETNWRSDGALVACLNLMFADVTFGEEQIKYHQQRASTEHEQGQIRLRGGGRVDPVLGIGIISGPEEEPSSRSRTKKKIAAADAEPLIARDLANYAVHLLSATEIPNGDDGHYRPVVPSDIAVLVNSKNQIPPIQRALEDAGIPSVLDRGESVLNSEAATQWKLVLNGVAAPSNPRRARAATLSCFFAESVVTEAPENDRYVEETQEQLARWSAVLERFGVVEFCYRLFNEARVAPRVLSLPGGDRLLTDLEHIASLLQANAGRTAHTAAGLLATLDELKEGAAISDQDDSTARRIQSEKRAVRIMTIHVSKGQEFPIVFLPTLWRVGRVFRDLDYVYEDPDLGRTIDLFKGEFGDKRKIGDLTTKEVIGEQLRLLYVALTRARHHCSLWWADAQDSQRSALARVLFARAADSGAIDAAQFHADAVSIPDVAGCLHLLDLALRNSAAASRVIDPHITSHRWELPEHAEHVSLAIATLDHELHRSRSRWSFSAMTPTREYGVRPDDDTMGDAGAADEVIGEPLDELVYGRHGDASDLPLGAMPAGAEFGTCVHEIFERVDFRSDQLSDSLYAAAGVSARRYGIGLDVRALADGLERVIDTPLGTAFGGRSLRSFSRADRLDELRFEMRLGEAAHGGRYPTNRDLGRLIAQALPPADPMRRWGERLATGDHVVELAGHLTGSIDLVLRLRAPGGPGRFVIVDYKTNSLAPRGRLPQLEDYRPDRLPGAMVAHDYPLQAVLYSVALHRYLRWRLADYDPALHLGGVAYLFVRGMAGGGVPHGVFHWTLPPALIESLSSLLHGEEPHRWA